MNKVVFLILRRMRAPLISLIGIYAVSVLGLVLIPGVDDQGNPWRMDFFHAFYFVSYMATTIGFGELPYPFTAAQRLWTAASIYGTVVVWLYAIGKILTLVQDPAFRQAVGAQAFARSVRRIAQPFYIICGYGDTGSLLVRALAEREINAVVLDIDKERINELELENLGIYVPSFCADANLSDNLVQAGLHHPHCVGVVALTDSDSVNLKVAITSKLLNPAITVICRAETHDAEANMASFGTDHIINPFDTFADRLALALHSPSTHLLHQWLTGVPNTPLAQPLYPPHGTWVLCGYGRFGKAVSSKLEGESVSTTIVESDPVGTGCVGKCVVGRGTEADTLLAAGITEAAGIVAGTDNDANNLSIIMTARELKPDLFLVARQNKRDNASIFRAAKLDLVMQRSDIIARTILALLMAPSLSEFLHLMREYDQRWANELVVRLAAVIGDVVPEVWTENINEDEAPAVWSVLREGAQVQLKDLLRDSRNRENYLNCVPLLLERSGEKLVTPEGRTPLQAGDRILFCGPVGVRPRMEWSLKNDNVLRYVLTGEQRPDGYVWRWWAARRAAGRPSGA